MGSGSGSCLPRDERRVGRKAEGLVHLGRHLGHPRLAHRHVKQTLHWVQRAHAAAPREVMLGQAAVRRLALLDKEGGWQWVVGRG